MTRTVEIEDQSMVLNKLKDALWIDPKTTAVVTVDMHRGHLDPVEATLPVSKSESERVRGHAKELLGFARKQGIPVIHIILVWRPLEFDKALGPRLAMARFVLSKSAPTTDAQKRGVKHNLEGSIQTELMPEIGPVAGDFIINNKKSLSIFMGTDLENLLIVLGIDTVILMGINTNTCVHCAAFEITNRMMKTVVISDCVASMYGPDLHILGLENINRCLGWVLTVEECKNKILSGKPKAAG